MNYKEQLTKVINKIDSNIEKINHPNLRGSSVNGKFTEEYQSFFDIEQWVFSFYTGMVFHAYNYMKDTKYIKYLYTFEEMYREKVYKHNMDTIHDLGFLYSLYAVAMYKTTGDQKAKEIALKAADELAKRFNIHGKYINAWGRMDQKDGENVGLMIADCMMNLPLLFWAYEETGHAFYRDVAMAHADTTLEYMIRDDDTICHAYKFERDTGKPIGERNDCGYSIGSAWARGTSWAIYGYAIAYGYTGKKEYLEVSQNLAEMFISNLKDDYVPIWDFKLDENGPKLLDTSAAAIAACGLLQLHEFKECKNNNYVEIAEKIISRLSEPTYNTLDENNDEMEGILKLQQGGLRQVYSMFGDYFYMEALMRLEDCVEIYW